jgi:RNA polymerase sigma-70 factor (ECF subfamily)
MAPVLAATLRRPAARLRTHAQAKPDFAEVAGASLDAVHKYVRSLVRDDQLAQDLTASTFERALRKWNLFDPRKARAEVWLCSIARNLVLDHWRRERRRRKAMDVLEQRVRRWHPPVDESGLGIAGLSGALEALSDPEREVIALRVLLDLSCEEAAQIIGITATACSSALHRALAKLRREMTDA